MIEMDDKRRRELAEHLGRQLSGHVFQNSKSPIELGWQVFKSIMLPKPEDEHALRTAYFAGAQHLYASIMNGLTEDREPTDADLARMSNVHNELMRFYQEMAALLMDQPAGQS